MCTYDRKCLFGHIINNNMQLNNAGEMVNKILQELPEYYSNMKTNEFIVMPNHVHVIVEIKEPVGAALRGRPLINTGMISNNSSNKNNMMDSGPAQRPAPTGQLSLSDIIYGFKSITTKHYIDGVKNHNWQPFDKHLWQRSFHDHAIRTSTSLENIRKYIQTNPVSWDTDEYNQNNKNHNKTIEAIENLSVCNASS